MPNDEVEDLVVALASPDVDRAALFDTFVAEDHIGTLDWAAQPSRLDGFYGHARRMLSQRLEIDTVGCDHGTAWLGECDDERIDSGASASEPPKLSRSASRRFGNRWDDVTGLEKPIGYRITRGVTLEAFDEHNRGHDGRPKALVP